MRIRFLLTLLLLLPFVAIGQTVIGSVAAPAPYSLLELSTTKIKGGIRMPPLTTAERDNLTTTAFINDIKAKGLAIYNTDTKCIEYWNSHKWISLCAGSADIGFKPNDPSKSPFPPEGGKVGPFTPEETPPCTGKTPYTYVVITGSDFMTIDITDNNTGAFTVKMSPNPTALVRTAIVRATNNCTGEYKEFMFSQDGDTKLCDISVAKPEIAMSNGGVLCIGGDVYMEITNVSAGAHYIWTINNIIQGQGTTFRATQSGTYKVYVGAIGCDKLTTNSVSKDVTVTLGKGTAPSNPITLSATNNGVICGATGEVTLTAYNVEQLSELIWYKDGKKSNKTGKAIVLKAIDKGDWTAVIKRDECISLPSQSITIYEDESSSALKKPMISINGKPLAQSNNFCSNGRLKLALNNPAGDYTSAVTVKWYNGIEYLGQGKELTIKAPSSGTNIVLRCIVSDNTGILCSAEFTETKKLEGTAPATPVITADPSLICGSANADLTASVTGGPYTFQWYKEGVLMPGQVNQTLTVSKIGSYQVEAIGDEGCISSLSTAILVGLSDFPTLEWKVIHDKVELNQTKIFQVSATFDPKLYTWTADNGAVIENGQGTNTVRVQFPNANATVNVTVVAENDCGISNKLTQEVEVAPACIAVVVKKTSINITGTTLAGNMLTMSVVADGSNTAAAPITYQWKRNGATITGATQSTFTINNIKKTDSGTYTCAVNNCSNIIVETTAGTIDVINEAILPKGSGVLVGEDCFDIASPINNNATCGLLTIREPNKANFSKSYTYTFTSIGENNKDLRFIINDAEQAVESYEVQKDIPTSLGNRATYTITVKYKQSLLTTVAGRDSNNPVNVTLVALFTTGGVESKLKLDITIKDCDCCTAVTDFEGNRYTAKLFGNACWMTQNLRSTVDKNGTSLGKVYFSAGKTNYAAPIVVTDTNGALDTGTVTYQDRVSVTESRNAFASKFGLYYIPANASKACPEGWHLPNTAEWRNLTKVISGKAMKANNNRYKGNDDSKLGCVWGGFDPIDSNNSGFNALPAGGLTATSGFNSISFGYAAIFNKRDGSNEWVTIYCFDTDLNVNDKFLDGGSVRCVRD